MCVSLERIPNAHLAARACLKTYETFQQRAWPPARKHKRVLQLFLLFTPAPFASILSLRTTCNYILVVDAKKISESRDWTRMSRMEFLEYGGYYKYNNVLRSSKPT